ncbi:MAG: hypothetical protein Q4A07_02230 [Coriobacteriales bacterium]|nr:hypothetical protein [Coriobacteriales bacterium]
MSEKVGLWARRMAAIAFVLVMAGVGLFAQGMAYAAEGNEGEVSVQVESADVVEEVTDEDPSVTEQSAVVLEQQEIALLQQENPKAVAFVSSNGTRTPYNNIGEALADWSDSNSEDTTRRDVTLTLLDNVTVTNCEPIRFLKRPGTKTLNLNGCTATFTMSSGNAGEALIYAGQGDELNNSTSTVGVNLVIDDYSSSADGALICKNAQNVIKVSSYNFDNGNNYSSSLELYKGTIRGGTESTVKVLGNEKSDSTSYGATFLMIDGAISGCVAANGSGEDCAGYGVLLYGKARFDMKGGTICDNNRGGVYLKCRIPYGYAENPPVLPLFNMYRGTVCDNGSDGVLLAKGGDFAMYGGTICDNGGAGVSACTTKNYDRDYATFTMSGGEITGNATGVYVRNDAADVFNLEGSPKILGNGSNGVACNVKLEGTLIGSSEFSKRIQITGQLATPDGADGPQIGVTIPADGTDVWFTDGYDAQNPKTDPATFFKYDSAVAKDAIEQTRNAFICWTQGENEAGTDHNPNTSGEASRLLHSHDWQPCYQYAINLNDNGKAQVSHHQENLLTAACINALVHPYARKHGACPHVLTATLTLSAQSKAFDGTPVIATLTASEGWQAENPYEYDTSKIEYFTKDGTPLSGAPKDVGDYVAQYKLDASKSWTPYEPLTNYDHITTSFSITPRVDPPTPPAPPATNNDVTYAAHCQTYGWNAPSGSNGTTAGTTGESKRLEALTIKLADQTAGSIEYRSHVQGIGWESDWAADGGQSGTVGKSKRVEALQVRLTGERAKNNSVWYRVHSQSFGWLGWAADGAPAGTAGMSRRVETYQVVVLPAGQTPADYDANAPAFRSVAAGNAHVQGVGWTGKKSAGIVGTTGKSKRLECLTLSVPAALTDAYPGGIAYEAHVQGKGWAGEVADGARAGTTGKSKRLEAVKIRLTGELAEHMSVWYRVHSQTYGWSGWACDGDPAGTTGLGRRAEAVEIAILPQGAAAPGSTNNALRAGK